MSNQLSMDLCGIEIKNFTIQYNPNLESEKEMLRGIVNCTPEHFCVYLSKHNSNFMDIYYVVNSLVVRVTIEYSIPPYMTIPSLIDILFSYTNYQIISALSKYHPDNLLEFEDDKRVIIPVDPNMEY